MVGNMIQSFGYACKSFFLHVNPHRVCMILILHAQQWHTVCWCSCNIYIHCRLSSKHTLQYFSNYVQFKQDCLVHGEYLQWFIGWCRVVKISIRSTLTRSTSRIALSGSYLLELSHNTCIMERPMIIAWCMVSKFTQFIINSQRHEHIGVMCSTRKNRPYTNTDIMERLLTIV
jgi:hypothetical protein